MQQEQEIPDRSQAPRKAFVLCNDYNTTTRDSDGLAPLKTCTGNALTALNTLMRRGFEVTMVCNASLKEATTHLKTFIESLCNGDVSLFYLSGYAQRLGSAQSAPEVVLYTSDGGRLFLHDLYINQLRKTSRDAAHIVVLDCLIPSEQRTRDTNHCDPEKDLAFELPIDFFVTCAVRSSQHHREQENASAFTRAFFEGALLARPGQFDVVEVAKVARFSVCQNPTYLYSTDTSTMTCRFSF